MGLGDLFKQNHKHSYTEISKSIRQNRDGSIRSGEMELKESPKIPDAMFTKCYTCGENIYDEELIENIYTCEHCGNHYRINGRTRIDITVDEGTFEEMDQGLESLNPLDYPGYDEKIKLYQDQTDEKDAVITGKGKINGSLAYIGIMDSTFMMGSMGSVVGEKLTRMIEKATIESLPVIIFTASGGARMQEGILSLMQMAKVSGALKKFSDQGNLYITVLTDPTTGGVTASFAMLGDIIISEPKALIGFAGRRVIEQTIRAKLPDEFQKAEFLMDHGFVDAIVSRKEMKETLGKILKIHGDK